MKKTINIAAIALLSAFATKGYSQGNAGQQSEELKYLMELEGKWDGPATMKMDGKDLKFPYYADFRKTAGNSGIEMYEWCEIPGMGKLTGTNLIGFDPFDGKIHWYSVDNLGTTHEHIGGFKDRDHYSMVHKSMREGKEYIETIEMVLMAKDKLTLKLVATLNGKEEEVITAEFHRNTGKPKTAR